MRAPPLPPMKVYLDETARLTEDFKAKEKGAYHFLLEYYWEWGRLEIGDVELARICRMKVRSFKKIRHLLLDLFDEDETGRWRDYDLERDRALAMETQIKKQQDGWT